MTMTNIILFYIINFKCVLLFVQMLRDLMLGYFQTTKNIKIKQNFTPKRHYYLLKIVPFKSLVAQSCLETFLFDDIRDDQRDELSIKFQVILNVKKIEFLSTKLN